MNNIYKTLCAVGVIGVLAGCTSGGVDWPRGTGGGMAEWEAEPATPTYSTEVSAALISRLAVVEWELSRLAASGGLRAVAADMALLGRSVVVIKREIAGELFVEAEKKLFSAELKLSTMKSRVVEFGKPENKKGLPVSMKL